MRASKRFDAHCAWRRRHSRGTMPSHDTCELSTLRSTFQESTGAEAETTIRSRRHSPCDVDVYFERRWRTICCVSAVPAVGSLFSPNQAAHPHHLRPPVGARPPRRHPPGEQQHQRPAHRTFSPADLPSAFQNALDAAGVACALRIVPICRPVEKGGFDRSVFTLSIVFSYLCSGFCFLMSDASRLVLSHCALLLPMVFSALAFLPFRSYIPFSLVGQEAEIPSGVAQSTTVPMASSHFSLLSRYCLLSVILSLRSWGLYFTISLERSQRRGGVMNRYDLETNGLLTQRPKKRNENIIRRGSFLGWPHDGLGLLYLITT